MKKALLTLAVLSAIAGQASAAEKVKVSIVGKTPEAIQADITRAARTVCFRTYSSYLLGHPLAASCVRDAVREAEADVAQAMAVNKIAGGQLASAK